MKNKNLKRVNTFLPLFSGFYSSIFDIDEYDEVSNYNLENDTDLTVDNFYFNYNNYHQEISKEICLTVETLLKDNNIIDSLIFEGLRSPRFYNFENDSINIEVVIKKDVILQYLKDNFNEFEAYINNNYTSYDGFSSYYSNDAKEWLTGFENDKLESETHQVGAILDFISINLLNKDDIKDVEFWLYENINFVPIEMSLK